MAKSPNWTEEELTILKDNYPKLGKSNAMQLLLPNRPIEGISLKANRIGLKVINNIRIGRTNIEYTTLLLETSFTALEEYKGSTEPIRHRCNNCSLEWAARPQQLLRVGAKCPACSLKARVSTEEYINEILDGANIFMHSEYTGALKHITVEHLSCGYIWNTTFSSIQQGSGCPLCNRGFGYSYNKENMPDTAILYLLRVNLDIGSFYKVGITTRKVSTRVMELLSRLKEYSPEIVILKELKDSGINILNKEKEILEKHKYIPYDSGIKFGGSTELLSIDNSLEELLKEYNE